MKVDKFPVLKIDKTFEDVCGAYKPGNLHVSYDRAVTNILLLKLTENLTVLCSIYSLFWCQEYCFLE